MVKADWDLTLPLSEARKNDEVISLGDSQVLDWIYELNELEYDVDMVRNITMEIKRTKKEPNTVLNKRKVKSLYEKLDKIQFVPDYMCLIIDRKKDLWRACKGFKVNNIKYVRLLGTNGGVKNETIVFVSERLALTLRTRIENGRNLNVELIPAKYEAYRALTCSGSVPVSMPNGILVVKDCETEFFEDVINLNDEGSGEPVLTYKKNEKIKLNESDGYGLMLPSLAGRWSEELELGYVSCGFNTRFSWEKGVVVCFDFLEFGERIANNYIVRDAWGNDVDVRSVELILTTSMLKLWMCYDNIDHYMKCCEENKYTFRISKICPRELENERCLNYQFIQSYNNLTEAQINELIQPTIDEIRDIISDDYRKAILFLRGKHLDKNNVQFIRGVFSEAIMIDQRIYNDTFVRRKIYEMVKKRIDEAKVGVVKIHGNYSVVSGDPYSLCQSIFGLPVTGLLKKGEIYNRYWVDTGTEKVVCFRAPMTCHNNIRLMNVSNDETAQYWYRYINTCTIFNSWDSAAHALNGMDKDGDLVLLTDNQILIDNVRPLPTIMCVQRNAKKIKITEESLIQSNIDSFGDDIGKTTNWITSMFEVQSKYDKNSEEYKVLDYRIMCGQLYQQNAIDKAKGIIAKPMPIGWYDATVHRYTQETATEEVASKKFHLGILADKKPYFMKYIYPQLMREYNTYISNTKKKCLRKFRLSIEELLSKDPKDLLKDEKIFIHNYRLKMPVGTNNCVMNKICKRFEEEFDGYLSKNTSKEAFNHNIMKGESDYANTQYYGILKLYKEYSKRMQDFSIYNSYVRLNEEDVSDARSLMVNDFSRACRQICSNGDKLCNIIIDICYKNEGSKLFCWDMCGEEIVANLLARNNNVIQFPTQNDEGDIFFCGDRFIMEQIEVIND